MHDGSNTYTRAEGKSLFWVKRCIISDMILLWFLISLFTLIGLPAVLVLISRHIGFLAQSLAERERGGRPTYSVSEMLDATFEPEPEGVWPPPPTIDEPDLW